MNIGKLPLRAKLRMTVHRGGVGQRPNRQSQTHPVADDETILSGMVMTLVSEAGALKWIKGFSGSSIPNQYFFAEDDSTDGDVQAAGLPGSGKLQGLSVHGDYELSTAQFTEPGGAVVYTAGTLLTPDAATGKVRNVKSGDTDVVVVGVVINDLVSPVNLAPTFTDLLPDGDANISAGVQGGTFTLGRATNAVDLRRLRFNTVAPYLATVV